MRYVRLSLLVVSLIIAGCSAEQPRIFWLEKAESEAAFKPEAALLTIYRNMPLNRSGDVVVDSLGTDADKALFGLVTTECIHRMGIYDNNDSLISISHEYYRKHNSGDRLVRATLHHGRALYETGERHKGVEMMKDAEWRGRGSENMAFRFDLNENLGYVNEKADNPRMAMMYYRKALEAASLSGDTTLIVRGMNNMVEMFDIMNMTDSMGIYLDRCVPMVSGVDEKLQAMVLTNMGCYNLRLKDTLLAESQLDKAMQTYPLSHKARMLMANIYDGQGKTEKACELWYEVMCVPDGNVNAEACQKLMGYFAKTGQWRRAAFVSGKLNNRYEKTYGTNDAMGIVSLQVKFDREKADGMRHRIVVSLLSVIIVLMVVIMSFVIYHRSRISNLNDRYSADLKAYNTTCNELMRLKQQKETDNTVIAEKMSEIEQLQTRLAEYQDDRRRPDSWNMQEQLLQDYTVGRLHMLAAHGKEADSGDWSELHRLAGMHLPALNELLYRTENLNAKEMNVCLLIRLRFIPSEIAALTATSPQTITNMRVRMLQKIFGERGGARDFDARIREI